MVSSEHERQARPRPPKGWRFVFKVPGGRLVWPMVILQEDRELAEISAREAARAQGYDVGEVIEAGLCEAVTS